MKSKTISVSADVDICDIIDEIESDDMIDILKIRGDYKPEMTDCEEIDIDDDDLIEQIIMQTQEYKLKLKFLRKYLRLREWATIEDIVNEIKNI